MSDQVILPRAVVEQALEALVMAQRDAQIGEADYAIAALRAVLAQRAVPGAWYDGGKFYGSQKEAILDCADMAALMSVYTVPPRREWQGLTEEEINELLGVKGVWWPLSVSAAVLRVIRAAAGN